MSNDYFLDTVLPQTITDHVESFHKTYGQPILTVPQVPSAERCRLRLRLITEEYFELLEAFGVHMRGLKYRFFETFDSFPEFEVRLKDVADALGDMDFINEGTRLEMGIPRQEIAMAIHRSNQTKLDANGNPVKDEHGKIVKGPNYEPPLIGEILTAYGWDGREEVVVK